MLKNCTSGSGQLPVIYGEEKCICMGSESGHKEHERTKNPTKGTEGINTVKCICMQNANGLSYTKGTIFKRLVIRHKKKKKKKKHVIFGKFPWLPLCT